ncbi:MAG: type II toxin-antitoxin system ParD family antitoxin [Crenarchaeota archaeon]|nr:type II toxin-antitoxin system ParD family antitoxin [Thermoproteota archaeon]
MRIVTVKMPESYIEAIDELVRMGRYSSRSEVIRAAVRELLKKELWGSDSDHEVQRKVGKSRIAVRDLELVEF